MDYNIKYDKSWGVGRIYAGNDLVGMIEFRGDQLQTIEEAIEKYEKARSQNNAK